MGQPRQINLKDFTLHLDDASISANGKFEYLSRTEFEVMKLIAGNAGRMVKKATILEVVFKNAVLENSVEVYVRYLRTKLERIGVNRKAILTRHRFGYMVQREDK